MFQAIAKAAEKAISLEALNEKVEEFNLLCEVASKKKGWKFKIDFSAEQMVAFAVEGFIGRAYRKNYNKSRWGQLKALKALAEDKNVSVSELLAGLGVDDAE